MAMRCVYRPRYRNTCSAPAEGGLGIDNPILAAQPPYELGKLFGLAEYGSGSGAAEFLPPIKTPEFVDKLTAKDTHKRFNWQKEATVTGLHPMLVIRLETSGRNHAVYMRMEQQVLTPGVQNGNHAESRPQALRVGRHLER